MKIPKGREQRSMRLDNDNQNTPVEATHDRGNHLFQADEQVQNNKQKTHKKEHRHLLGEVPDTYQKASAWARVLRPVLNSHRMLYGTHNIWSRYYHRFSSSCIVVLLHHLGMPHSCIFASFHFSSGDVTHILFSQLQQSRHIYRLFFEYHRVLHR
jgi:hypothetical protein